jgi:hypothetical protein
MLTDLTLLISLVAFATLIALPALAASGRARVMREASEVAGALSTLAVTVRKSAVCPPLDEKLWSRAQRLGAPEFSWLLLAHELPRPSPVLLADTAQRLALRLRRRVAFERKMLARTASGRRRGAVAATAPPIVLVALHVGGFEIPLAALLCVVAMETCGCWWLWRVARVEI